MRSPLQGPEQADFERIVPRVPAGAGGGRAPAQTGADAAARISAGSFWIAAGALTLLALLVFWLLPRWVGSPSPAVREELEAAVPAPPAETMPDAPSRGPVEALAGDEARLEARAAAQTARAQFEQQLAALQARGVQTWGAGPLAAAQSQATAAAGAFAARDFFAARSAYQAAAGATDALLGEIPQRLSAALAAGAQALEAGDKAAAQQAFDLAQVLQPGNAQARQGLQRVASLDAVRARLDTARRLEQAGDIAGARAAWKQALALDPDTRSAREALARLDARSRDSEFGRALGEAIEALDHGRYELAEKHLARARALRSTDPAVQQAATRLAEGRRAQNLAVLEREAAARAGAEDWTGAAARYRSALALDPTVAFARDGLARAEPRADLAQRLQGFIERPERLSAAAVAADAARTLQQARGIDTAGPRLAGQIAALERALEAASTPVAVTLLSDGKTEVTVHRQGALGRFESHTLQLRPGHYVAVGSRPGYRDVRQEFDVAAGTRDLHVDVRCEESL